MVRTEQARPVRVPRRATARTCRDNTRLQGPPEKPARQGRCRNRTTQVPNEQDPTTSNDGVQKSLPILRFPCSPQCAAHNVVHSNSLWTATANKPPNCHTHDRCSTTPGPESISRTENCAHTRDLRESARSARWRDRSTPRVAAAWPPTAARAGLGPAHASSKRDGSEVTPCSTAGDAVSIRRPLIRRPGQHAKIQVKVGRAQVARQPGQSRDCGAAAPRQSTPSTRTLEELSCPTAGIPRGAAR